MPAPLPMLPDGPGLLLVISGPAGSGKTTLCDELLALAPRARRVVTCTSRAPRPGERDGADYHFLTNAQFESGLAAGDFFEHALVHGRHYGSRKSDVIAQLERRLDLVFVIDVQGAANLRAKAAAEPALAGRVVTVFLFPPSVPELRARLLGRGQDQAEEIERRLKNAAGEIARWREFDYCLPCGAREDDLAHLLAIYAGERQRQRPGMNPPAIWPGVG